MAQIAALEAEVAKVQKALDSAKATYNSLQKQYQEQCGTSVNLLLFLNKTYQILKLSLPHASFL